MPTSVSMFCWGFTLDSRLTMKCQAVESVMSGAGWFSSQNREVVSGSSWEEELGFLHISFMPLQLLDSGLECLGSLLIPLPHF